VDTQLGIETLCLIGFVGAVAFVDLRTRRIPNWLTVAAAALGVAVAAAKAGWQGTIISGAGVLTGLAIFLPFCLAGKLGAGDVKAMGAVGAFLGPVGVLLAALYTLLAGGIGAALTVVTSRRTAADRSASVIGRQQLPYGLAIACGTLASIVWRFSTCSP
jgi:prepilin peptidase CpaA